MEAQGKNEVPRGLVAGRIEELRRLEASERGLARAVLEYASASGDGHLYPVAERHRRLAAALADRLRELGGQTDLEPDDLWIIGPTNRLDTILFAEQSALRTYHDHLLDLDPDTMRLVREHILPAHQQTLDQLEQQG